MAALWWAVVISGLYHGINPGMGWPLAVSAALMEQRNGALPRALGLLALGHFIAMIVVLLPFSLMLVLVEWEVEIRVAAGLAVIAMGVFLLIYRRHPRFLARVHPARLALWSFLAALAHGAALMLLPIYLGICAIGDSASSPLAAESPMGNSVLAAFAVAAAHTAAMTLAGAGIAAAIHAWLGLRFLSRGWFNLDLPWALSLILVGAFGIHAALTGH